MGAGRCCCSYPPLNGTHCCRVPPEAAGPSKASSPADQRRLPPLIAFNGDSCPGWPGKGGGIPGVCERASLGEEGGKGVHTTAQPTRWVTADLRVRTQRLGGAFNLPPIGAFYWGGCLDPGRWRVPASGLEAQGVQDLRSWLS